MSWKRWATGLGAMLAVGAVSGATALAAGNTLNVKAPSSVKLGDHYEITTSGHASGQANYIVGFETTVPCKSNYRAESKFLGYPTTAPLGGPVSGDFSKVVKFHAQTPGNIYWCAYLVNFKSVKTYAFAKAHFKEHH